MGQQIIQVLEQAFPGIQTELREMPSGRLSSNVIWDGFNEHDMVDRQEMGRDALTGGLGPQAQQVGVLLTYTPHEMSVMKAA